MIFDFLKIWREQRAEAAAIRDSLARQRAYEAESQRRAAFAREERIAAIRVITGDLKHRYAIVDTVRAFGLYTAQPGEDYDPTEATRRAQYHLQTQAIELGADAIIHATYQVLRYAEQRHMRQHPVPVYEVHAFGTAVKIVGPPTDWQAEPSTPEEENPAW